MKSITPIHPRFMTHKTKFNLGQYKNCITLSLPSPRCFTSGEPIPFVLSFVFPKDPMLASLLGPTAQIHLSRQVTVSRNGGKANVQRDTCLSSAELRTLKEFREGVILLRGDIQAGTPGGEASWRLENVIEVQHEEIVEITTDYWGTLERELASVGGTPMPALGLAKSLRRDI
ncbi:hypothetical protein DXG01_015107 [Tephrocybe rancida]|nr:hypothetical protein DXG01_015107 [Tephrocybe rancida]